MTTRRFSRAALLAGLLASVGCTQPRRTDRILPDSPTGTEFVARLHLIVVTQNGAHQWTPARIQRQMAETVRLWDSTRIMFKFSEVEFAERSWYAVSGHDTWTPLCQESWARYNESGELPVWLVDSLVWNGKVCTGMANLPSNVPVLPQFQHGICVTYNAAGPTMAHELGHSFNLWHTEDHQFPFLGACPTQFDCAVQTNCSCNMMSYCWQNLVSGTCLYPPFVEDQDKEVRRWCLQPERVKAVTALVPPSKVAETLKIRVQYADNKDPQVD